MASVAPEVVVEGTVAAPVGGDAVVAGTVVSAPLGGDSVVAGTVVGADHQQRLMFGGRQLAEGSTLNDILDGYKSQDGCHTFHLVVSHRRG